MTLGWFLSYVLQPDKLAQIYGSYAVESCNYDKLPINSITKWIIDNFEKNRSFFLPDRS